MESAHAAICSLDARALGAVQVIEARRAESCTDWQTDAGGVGAGAEHRNALHRDVARALALVEARTGADETARPWDAVAARAVVVTTARNTIVRHGRVSLDIFDVRARVRLGNHVRSCVRGAAVVGGRRRRVA